MNLDDRILGISPSIQTPFLAIDLNILRSKYLEIVKGLPGVEVMYAMKANNDDEILKSLLSLGCGFEIASESELRQLVRLGADLSNIICMHPIKNSSFLKAMRETDIRVMACDSSEEIDKIGNFFPDALLVLRIEVDNADSDWPLTKKFGVSPKYALDLLAYAKSKNLNPYGITFHVGSQCRNPSNWSKAITTSKEIFVEARSLGVNLRYLSLGGGLPIKQEKEVPSINEIGKYIMDSLDENFKGENMRYSIEPGRGLIGDSGIMVSTVVGKALRGRENWLYADAGVFNALMETVEKYKYEIISNTGRSKKNYTIGGPSCDSVDIIAENVELEEVNVGDMIYIMNAAAYSTVYGASFNGFSVPRVVYV